MTTARVVHVRDKVPDAVYIGRPAPHHPGSLFANPFKIGRDGSREEVIHLYHHWLFHEYNGRRALFSLHKLRGKPLACWCRHDGAAEPACHGDILLDLLNRYSDIALEALAVGAMQP